MLNREDIEELFVLLNNLLEERNKKISLVICGGSSLILTGLIKKRVFTQDIDVLGTIPENKKPQELQPIPAFLQDLISEISKTLNLPEDWINDRAHSLTKGNLPEGFENRLIEKTYGKNLTIYFLSRIDQIFFKLYATIDQGAGKHFQDLMELNPSEDELLKASLWCIKQDPSTEFKEILKDFLRKTGYEKIADRI